VPAQTHFGKFTGWYTENKFYFDIHPPLGKLTFWFFGKLLGYRADMCKYENLSVAYGPHCNYWILRSVSASFSTATCVLLFFCARNFGATVKGAALSAMLIVFDMISVGEGRLILMDAQLIFWLVACLYVAQRWWQRRNQHDALVRLGRVGPLPLDVTAAGACGLRPLPTVLSGGRAALPMLLPERLLWCLVVGIACGNAPNVKMTGLVTPALVAMESFFGLWFLNSFVPFWELLVILSTSILTYSFWFAVSFCLMVNSGVRACVIARTCVPPSSHLCSQLALFCQVSPNFLQPNKVEKEFMTPLVREARSATNCLYPHVRSAAVHAPLRPSPVSPLLCAPLPRSTSPR